MKQLRKFIFREDLQYIISAVAIVTGYFVSRFAYSSCIASEGFLSGMRHIDTSKPSANSTEKELH